MWKFFEGPTALSFILLMAACSPTVQESSVTIEGAAAESIMVQMGMALANATPSSEDEGLVFNHLQNLWHYIQVSSKKKITVNRKSWMRGSVQIESISAVFDGDYIGAISIQTQDTDALAENGIEEGFIKFSEEVESPEKGTGHGAIYPFGSKTGNQVVPPSFQLELPGGYFVPAGGLQDIRKRFMTHQEAIAVLRNLCQDTSDLGLRMVDFGQD